MGALWQMKMLQNYLNKYIPYKNLEIEILSYFCPKLVKFWLKTPKSQIWEFSPEKKSAIFERPKNSFYGKNEGNL